MLRTLRRASIWSIGWRGQMQPILERTLPAVAVPAQNLPSPRFIGTSADDPRARGLGRELQKNETAGPMKDSGDGRTQVLDTDPHVGLKEEKEAAKARQEAAPSKMGSDTYMGDTDPSMELSQQPKRQDTAMSMNTEQGMDTEVGSETEWRKQAENRAMDYGGQSQAMEENLAQGMKNQETRTQAMEGSVTGQSPGIDNARMQGTQDDMNYEDTGTSERLHGSKMHDHSKDPAPGTSTRSSRSRTEQSSGGSSLRHLMKQGVDKVEDMAENVWEKTKETVGAKKRAEK